MTLLLIFAAMTVGVLTLLLVPMLRSRGSVTVGRGTYDLAIYKDQLAEVDRDLARDLLTPTEAEAVRVEIQRRILAISDITSVKVEGGIGRGVHWLGAALIALGVPFAAFGLYLTLGQPDLPDQPFASRAAEEQQMVELVDQLAKRMEATPDNPKGWVLLGRSNTMIGRHAEAAEAFRRAIQLGSNDAETLTMYGEALTVANRGMVPDPARTAFLSAFQADPAAPGPQFYLGVAASQGGEASRAVAIWRHLEQISAADAPWLPELRERIATVAAEIGPAAASIAPAPPSPVEKPEAGRFTPEQSAMVTSMVERLAARLSSNPDDFDGWMQLGRSYLVLGDPAKAAEAYTRAIALRPDNASAKAGLAEAQAGRSP